VRPDDPRVVALAAAIVDLVDALAKGSTERGDELVALTSCGVERRALRRLVRDGRLEVVRIGRRQYTTRRALAALVRPSVAGCLFVSPAHYRWAHAMRAVELVRAAVRRAA
jgi:hypothetical protein